MPAPPLPASSAANGSIAPVAPAPIPPEVVQALGALLAEDLGPLAATLARRTAVTSRDAAALVRRLADETLLPKQRERFIERARAFVPQAPAAQSAPAVAAPPVLGDTPLEDALIDAARALLAPRYGAVAAVMVRRAAQDGATRERFIERLTALAADASERDALAAALCRLG
jgi:hypothetical protein